ncbi:hypothetical protein NUH86_21305 [Sphingobium sp. JS3065]|uniref:hypothetical protein n=1 Tax=Sphingobium sp. JS3065 TaxID=2970925 RepID=UPI0022641743|nr:hypothetical protein [Sphingobium sp. JS3065]UZW57813.1 hypothetical protein NUH86_21305 [Sphingobium sp. JS3065]
MRDFSSSADHALLLLGRLDGRLCNSPATDIWLARARLKGAAALASFAGVPVFVADLQNWICGRTPPPRHSEGLNDPLSVAALFHFALSATDGHDPIVRATLNISRTLLDDRKEADLWAPEDLVRFGPAWRMARMLIEAPYPTASFQAIAQRLIDARASLDAPVAEGPLVTTADGRQWRIEPRRFDMGWLLACHLPGAFAATGLSLRRLPSLVDLPRFLPDDAGLLAERIAAMVARQAGQGLTDLDRLEAKLKRLPAELQVTRRSKAPLLMRLLLAYPGLGKAAVARLLGISHQGATKLLARVESLTEGV